MEIKKTYIVNYFNGNIAHTILGKVHLLENGSYVSESRDGELSSISKKRFEELLENKF